MSDKEEYPKARGYDHEYDLGHTVLIDTVVYRNERIGGAGVIVGIRARLGTITYTVRMINRPVEVPVFPREILGICTEVLPGQGVLPI
jgi:hypothetical protein